MNDGMTRNLRNMEYLGDGLYAEYDGYGIWLCTRANDIVPTNMDRKIYLEPMVFQSLCKYVEKVKIEVIL